MGTLSLIEQMGATATPFRLKAFLWRSILLGVATALLSGPVTIYLTSVASMASTGLPIAPAWEPQTSIEVTSSDIWLGLLLILVVAPLGESLVFPPLNWLTRRLPLSRAIFIAAIGVLAFFAHGGTVSNSAQAMGFMLMAAWYASLAERFPAPRLLSTAQIPFYGIVLTHFAWNLTAVAWTIGVPLFWSTLYAMTP